MSYKGKTREEKAPAPKLMNKGREMSQCRVWAKYSPISMNY